MAAPDPDLPRTLRGAGAPAGRSAALGSEAALELSLYEAERRVSELEADRERLLADIDRRQEHVARELTAPLRRALATAEAEIAVLTAERERLRASLGRTKPLWEGEDEAEAAIVHAREALVSQLSIVRNATGLVRDGLGSAVRALQDQVASERAGREAAEAMVAQLRSEIAIAPARDAEAADSQAALAVSADLLATRLDAVRVAAGALREGLAAQDQLRMALSAMEGRLVELQSGLREELEVERAARWVAERELDAERAAHALTRSELRAAREETRREPDAETVASLRETLDRLQASAPPAAPAPPAVGFDLAAAAERLRATAPADPELEPEPEEEGAGLAGVPNGFVVAAAAAGAQAAPEAPRDPAVPLPAQKGREPGGAWLSVVLGSFAAAAPAEAERLFLQLLPAQAGIPRRRLSYDVAVADGGTHRVVVDQGRVSVEAASGEPWPDSRLAGSLAALSPLAVGGAGWRLPGVQITGRGKVRRLLRARRRPVALADLARAEVGPEPALLLKLLAHGCGTWSPATADRATKPTVDVDALGVGRVRVSLRKGAQPEIAEPTEAPATATLRVPAGALLSVLAGTAPAGVGLVEGDLDLVLGLLALLRSPRGA